MSCGDPDCRKGGCSVHGTPSPSVPDLPVRVRGIRYTLPELGGEERPIGPREKDGTPPKPQITLATAA